MGPTPGIIVINQLYEVYLLVRFVHMAFSSPVLFPDNLGEESTPHGVALSIIEWQSTGAIGGTCRGNIRPEY